MNDYDKIMESISNTKGLIIGLIFDIIKLIFFGALAFELICNWLRPMEEEVPLERLVLRSLNLCVLPIVIANVHLNEVHNYQKGAIHLDIHPKS